MGIRSKRSTTLLDQAHDLVDRIVPQIETAIGTAKDKAGPVIADARDRTAPFVTETRDKITDTAGPLVAEARDRTAPFIAEAREKAAPAVAGARDKLNSDVLPAIVAAVAAADKATEDRRAEARRRGIATMAALKGEVEAPKEQGGGKLKRIFLVAALIAIGGLVFKKLKGDSARDAWQASYRPSPPPRSAPVPSSPVEPAAAAAAGVSLGPTDDAGAAAPDEALSDAAGQPHPVTTPDDPAEVVELDPTREANSWDDDRR